MADDELIRLLQAALNQRRALARDRRRTIAEHISITHLEIDGRRLVNFCSNDYLGLSRHPKIAAAMAQATAAHGAGSGASPLISGYLPVHESAERALARWKGTQAALLLPSGYQANHAAIGALLGAAREAGRRVRFLLDKLVHASLVDAVRGGGALRIFAHNDMQKLARLLRDADADELQVVVTESIFSMDGDAAPLAELARLKRAHHFVLLLDEAHGSGVYGAHGAGYANELGLSDIVDISIVTLSKALGASGGAICCCNVFRDAVLNFGRAYIYSTSVAPAVAAAAEAAIDVLRDEPERQRRVRELARRVRSALTDAGMKMAAGDSPIIPIVLGEERRVAAAAKRLEERGLLVLPIRPPTVAKGSSRLRVTLCCEHTDSEIELLLTALKETLR